MPPTRTRRTTATKKAPRTQRRITISERLSGAPVRYYKRGGRVMARCQHCGTLVRGGMRGMAKHAKDCKDWNEGIRLMIQTPYEVKKEIERLNRELGECREELRCVRC